MALSTSLTKIDFSVIQTDETSTFSGIISATSINASGIVSATTFIGNGSGLTGVGIGSTGSINTSGIITANSFSGDGSQLTGISRIFTIGTRVGSAVTFNLTGSSFNVFGRSGNISISV